MNSKPFDEERFVLFVTSKKVIYEVPDGMAVLELNFVECQTLSNAGSFDRWQG